ncbi:hypothetical protein ACF07F_34785 [Streptomyces sp. NPDC015237]|uniref:hypothetical protein n=1 Tax=Streptomyces sp. NPDC015237 TaxID=3364949 RepID=UPI003702F25A
MNWRTFCQRVTVVVLISALVILLIAIGLDPNLALSLAAAIVLISKDLWWPGSQGGHGQKVGSVASAGESEE